MSTPQHPEALRLANELDAEFAQGRISNHTGRKAATELRRQHARIAELEAQLESIAASAGSEPVAQAKGVFEFWWADHMPNATQAEAWREWCEVMRPGPIAFTHPSPPEGMVGWWIASKDQMPPPGVRVFWGDVDSNRVGYDFWAGDDYRWAPSHWMHIPEFAAPPAGSGKGE